MSPIRANNYQYDGRRGHGDHSLWETEGPDAKACGYPSIASELDENLIQELMPKIEKRSWDLVALNNK